MSIVLRHSDKSYWGTKIAMCNVGVQTPSKEDGTFTIENDDHANALVADNVGVVYHNEEDNKTPATAVTVKDDSTEGDEDKKEGVKEEPETEAAEFTAEEKAEIKSGLEGKKKEELEQDCAAFPNEEWKGKKKAELVDYLMSKLA